MRTLAGHEINVLFTRSASTALSNTGQLPLAIVTLHDRRVAPSLAAKGVHLLLVDS